MLDPLYANGTLVKAKAGDQFTDWDPIKGRQIFDQMLARNNNDIKGSIAANDGLAGAVIASLKAHGLKPIPLTGQDATPTGVQFILAGDQSGTVYKSVKKEADAAAKAAIAIVKGQPVQRRERHRLRHQVDPADAGLDHEEELQAPLRRRLPEEEPGLHRAVRPVLQLTVSSAAGAPSRGRPGRCRPNRVDERATPYLTFTVPPYSCPPSAVPRKERQ